MTTDARRHSSPIDTTTAPPRTRIAPTPSGYLHEGNLVNALLTVRLADEMGAEVALRIDDMDAFRLRREYVEDIFRCLDWLGLSWQTGPRHRHPTGGVRRAQCGVGGGARSRTRHLRHGAPLALAWHRTLLTCTSRLRADAAEHRPHLHDGGTRAGMTS